MPNAHVDHIFRDIANRFATPLDVQSEVQAIVDEAKAANVPMTAEAVWESQKRYMQAVAHLGPLVDRRIGYHREAREMFWRKLVYELCRYMDANTRDEAIAKVLADYFPEVKPTESVERRCSDIGLISRVRCQTPAAWTCRACGRGWCGAHTMGGIGAGRKLCEDCEAKDCA